MNAASLARFTFFALLLLQPLWHLLLDPAQRVSSLLVTGLFLLPLLPVAWLLWRGRPSGQFWAGVVALPYFCHGIMEAWANADVRGIALAETALSLVVVLAVGLDGWHRRQAARRAAGQG